MGGGRYKVCSPFEKSEWRSHATVLGCSRLPFAGTTGKCVREFWLLRDDVNSERVGTLFADAVQ